MEINRDLSEVKQQIPGKEHSRRGNRKMQGLWDGNGLGLCREQEGQQGLDGESKRKVTGNEVSQ